MWLWVETNIPFRGRCATHFITYFSGCGSNFYVPQNGIPVTGHMDQKTRGPIPGALNLTHTQLALCSNGHQAHLSGELYFQEATSMLPPAVLAQAMDARKPGATLLRGVRGLPSWGAWGAGCASG